MEQQMIFISPEITQKFGAAVNNVASLICLLSKNGEQEVNITETFMSERVALSVRLVRKAKKILKDNGYIDIETSSKGFKRVTVIKVTKKMAQSFYLPNRNSVPNHTGTVCLNDAAQCAVSDRHDMPDRNGTECQNIRHSVPMDAAQCACSDAAQCAYINKKEIYKKNNKEIYSAPNFLNDIPLPDDEYEPVVEERDDMPVNLELVPLETNTATTEQYKKKSATKRKTVVTYPASSDEVLELFKGWRDKHVKLEPRIQGVNLALEAEKFFEYWSENDWARKGKKIKSVNGSIATWLGNACERVRGNYKAPDAEAEDKMRAIVEQFNPDKTQPVEAEFEIVNDNVSPEMLEVLMR